MNPNYPASLTFELMILESARKLLIAGAEQPDRALPRTLAAATLVACNVFDAIQTGDPVEILKWSPMMVAGTVLESAGDGSDMGHCPCCDMRLLPFKIERRDGHNYVVPLPGMESADILAVSEADAMRHLDGAADHAIYTLTLKYGPVS